jgi:Asp-tRNA(Asn)/Glu-tRNA(Gln) amidotransferase A subunit family amidase
MRELPDSWLELKALIERGELTPDQAVQQQLQRMTRLAPGLHCVVTGQVDPQPRPSGPLSGLALAHKDIFDLPGRAPGLGLGRGHADASRRRAVALDRLAQAGAAQSAALVMAPLACGATGQNPHFERALNPLDPAWALGGSSSGCAAAVAAGLSYFSLGTDTAGSVRIPAASCGILGLKTTHGLIDSTGCAPLAPSLDSIGILARHAQDLRAALEVLAPDLQAPARSKDLTLRAWLPTDTLAADVADCIQSWLAQRATQGAALRTTQPVDLSGWQDRLSVHAQRVLCHEVAQTHRQALLQGVADPSVQALGHLGLAMPADWPAQSLALRGTLLEQFVHEAFGQADLLVLPSLPMGIPDWDEVQVGQPRFDAKALLALHRHMAWVNYLGLPALNLPIGHDARQRPVCVQLLARPFGEHLLLDVAQRCAIPGGRTQVGIDAP